MIDLKGELWGISCEDVGENWPRYNGTALHMPVIYAIVGSDNILSPIRRQAIIWTNDAFWLIGSSATDFGQIWIKTQ